jgi:hypothetical protein
MIKRVVSKDSFASIVQWVRHGVGVSHFHVRVLVVEAAHELLFQSFRGYFTVEERKRVVAIRTQPKR